MARGAAVLSVPVADGAGSRYPQTMADDVLTITVTLDERTAARVKAAADEIGMPLEQYVAETMADHAEHPVRLHDRAMVEGEPGWREAKDALEHYDRTGEYVDAEPAMNAFVAEVDARAARRR